MHLGAIVPERQPEDILCGVKRLGLSATGLALAPQDALNPAATRMLGTRLRSAGVTVSQVGCYTNLECAPGSVRNALLGRLKAVIRAAGMAGARCVVSGVGHMVAEQEERVFAAHPANWSDRAMGRLVDSCAEAAETALEAGTRFCVEPWVITTLNTPQRVGELLTRVDSRGFGILFDPVNLMSLDTYFDNQRVIEECFQRAGDAIFLVHAKDTRLVESSFTYHMAEVPPGEGILDYRTLLRCMEKLSDVDTPLLIEHLSDYSQIGRARDHIRRVAAEEGVLIEPGHTIERPPGAGDRTH